MSGIVDFHSHILPGIDDGSASVEESITMLRMEADQGIRKIVATPHFYPHHDAPERFLHRRKEAEERLREGLRGQEDLPEIILGAEVYYYPGISDSERLSDLTIGGKPFILIEMPPSPWKEGMYRELADIQEKRGITPVIAHIDRYISPLKTHGILRRLEELPVLIQANASFFRQRMTRDMAVRMLRKDQIQLVGSDCHNVTSRAPNIGEAKKVIEKHLGQQVIDRIISYQDQILMNDHEVSYSAMV